MPTLSLASFCPHLLGACEAPDSPAACREQKAGSPAAQGEGTGIPVPSWEAVGRRKVSPCGAKEARGGKKGAPLSLSGEAGELPSASRGAEKVKAGPRCRGTGFEPQPLSGAGGGASPSAAVGREAPSPQRGEAKPPPSAGPAGGEREG